MSEMKIIFSNYSDDYLDNQTISQIVGCNPTSFWQKGESIRNGLQVRKEYSWNLEIPYIVGNETDFLINRLISEIKNPDATGEYCKLNNLQTKIDFVIQSVEDTFPSVFFSNEFILLCAKLQACIDIDVIMS